MNVRKILFKITEYIAFVVKGGHRTLKNYNCSILSREESLNQVLQNINRKEYKGFIRFGDGEYQLIRGLSIGFQTASENLSRDLNYALHNTDNLDIDIAVDIPSYNEISSFRIYKRISVFPWSFFYINNIQKEKSYLYTGFTTPYFLDKRRSVYDKDKVSLYIEKFTDLFLDKKVVLFIGEGIYNKITYLPFEKSRVNKVEECPSCDAYDQIESILNRAKHYSDDWLLCFCIGPASKVVAYHLMGMGYRCFDLGHFIKDYDMYKKDEESLSGFYDPDL